MANKIRDIFRKMKEYIENKRNGIAIICVICALVAIIIGIAKGSIIIAMSAGLLALLWMILESGIVNVIMYIILAICLEVAVRFGKSSYNMPGYIILTSLGIFLIIISIKIFNEFINKSEQEQESVYIIFLIVFFLGVGATTYSVIELMHSMISLFTSWGIQKKDCITGVSLLITITTFFIGQFLKVQGDKLSRKQEKQIALHKEMDWRRELWDLEVQPEYSIQDLIKLNSFFNPKHSVKDEENIDVRLNTAVVNILSKYTCRNSVYFNKSENDKKENEPLVTLFDYSLTEDVINQKLNPEENQEIRELIHELLKVDWDRQTKY